VVRQLAVQQITQQAKADSLEHSSHGQHDDSIDPAGELAHFHIHNCIACNHSCQHAPARR
jgi:hypothetical protein